MPYTKEMQYAKKIPYTKNAVYKKDAACKKRCRIQIKILHTKKDAVRDG
jgi:hypothetical protein